MWLQYVMRIISSYLQMLSQEMHVRLHVKFGRKLEEKLFDKAEENFLVMLKKN
jgi:hypothetical protein